MKIKKKLYDEQVNYLIYLKKTEKITINDLSCLTGINHIRVRWAKYDNSKLSPAQCRRCQSFGHGMDSCFRNPKCVKCALNHWSHECPLKPTTGVTLEKHQLRCANCSEHHTANYSKCKTRINYTTSSVNRTQPRPAPIRRTDPQLDAFNLPSRFGPQPWTTRPAQATRAPSAVEDLLPPEVIEEVFNDLFANLRGCRTAQDQILAIGKTVSKFLYYKP